MRAPTVDAVLRALRGPDQLGVVVKGTKGLNTDPPASAGLYAWYFDPDSIPVPLDGCHFHDGRALLYVGIAPKDRTSKATLRSRILRQHLGSNASGSTLRRTLACVLEPVLGTQLRRIGRSERIRLPASGEAALSHWMAEHASVAWCRHASPWEVEAEVIRMLSAPLNLDHNRDHPFYGALSGLRKQSATTARRLPVLPS